MDEIEERRRNLRMCFASTESEGKFEEEQRSVSFARSRNRSQSMSKDPQEAEQETGSSSVDRRLPEREASLKRSFSRAPSNDQVQRDDKESVSEVDSTKSLEESMEKLKGLVIRQQKELRHGQDQLNALVQLVRDAWSGDKSAMDHLTSVVGKQPTFSAGPDRRQSQEQADDGVFQTREFEGIACSDDYAYSLLRSPCEQDGELENSFFSVPPATPPNMRFPVPSPVIVEKQYSDASVQVNTVRAPALVRSRPASIRTPAAARPHSSWEYQYPGGGRTPASPQPATSVSATPCYRTSDGKLIDIDKSLKLVHQVNRTIAEKDLNLRSQSAPPPRRAPPEVNQYTGCGHEFAPMRVPGTNVTYWKSVGGTGLDPNFTIIGRSQKLESPDFRQTSSTAPLTSTRPISPGQQQRLASARRPPSSRPASLTLSRGSCSAASRPVTCTSKRTRTSSAQPMPTPTTPRSSPLLTPSPESELESGQEPELPPQALHPRQHVSNILIHDPTAHDMGGSYTGAMPAPSKEWYTEGEGRPEPSPYRIYTREKPSVPISWAVSMRKKGTSSRGTRPLGSAPRREEYRMYKIARGTTPVYIDHDFLACWEKSGNRDMCDKCNIIEADRFRSTGGTEGMYAAKRSSRRKKLPAHSRAIQGSPEKSKKLHKVKLGPFYQEFGPVAY